MNIRVLFEKNEFEVAIPASSTVFELKQLLFRYTNLNPDSQKLILRLPTHKVILNDSFPITSYNITIPLCVNQIKTGPQVIELSRWVNRLISACQEANLDSFYEVLKDYERYKKEALEVEDLKNIINTPYNNK